MMTWPIQEAAIWARVAAPESGLFGIDQPGAPSDVSGPLMQFPIYSSSMKGIPAPLGFMYAIFTPAQFDTGNWALVKLTAEGVAALQWTVSGPAMLAFWEEKGAAEAAAAAAAEAAAAAGNGNGNGTAEGDEKAWYLSPWLWGAAAIGAYLWFRR